jgi:hypothetical protein
MISWFRPQNQADYGFSVAPQNRREGDGVGHVSRSSGLLYVEASRATVSQSDLKIGGDATTGAHVAPSQRLHLVQAKDGQVDVTVCIRSF